MADTRIFTSIRGLKANEWASNTGASQTTISEAQILEIRNAFRTSHSNVRYKVSDIAKWQGQTSNVFGYGFILRDTSEDHEFLFVFGSFITTTTSYISHYIGNNNQTVINNNVAAFQNFTSLAGISVGSTQGSIVVHYNPSYAAGTYAMGFNDTTNLTYTGGDFSAAPSVSPYASLDTFLPGTSSTRWKMIAFSAIQSIGLRNHFDFIYDPDVSFLTIGVSQATPGSYQVIQMGEIFPLNADGGLTSATDTQQRGIIAQTIGGQSSSDINSILSISPMFVSFRREDGTWEQHTGRLTNVTSGFTPDNYKTAGQIQYRKLRVEIPSTYNKGYINPLIAIEAFPSNDSRYLYARIEFASQADKPLIRCHRDLCFAWKKDIPWVNQTPMSLSIIP